MMMLLAAVLCLCALALMLPVLVFAVQITCACLARMSRHEGLSPEDSCERPRLAVLVPAHNEAGGILETLKALQLQLREGDRLLVVADNCSDCTAGVAREAGAEVIERSHATLRGKGYALDYGVRHLSQDPPEVLVIVDADCLLEPGAMDLLALRCVTTGRAIQALYLMHGPAEPSLKQRIAEFAWRVKNLVRPLGFSVLGLPCQLMGTGMAFKWTDISTSALANGHLVEDMKLGVDLALRGRAPLFCPEARVTSLFPESEAGASSQRTRWEHGHLGVIAHDVPRMLLAALKSRNLALLAMAFDLLVPPLALLCLLVTVLTLSSAAYLLAWGAYAPLLLSGAALLMLSGAVVAAWLRFGRTIVSLQDLILAVVYVAWKIPMYLKFMWGKQVEWVRTRRDD